MSMASEGIWFPIANNHHLHNPINDQAADINQPAINPHETIPGKPGANRKPLIRFPIPMTNIPMIRSAISRWMISTPPSNRQPSIHPGYRFLIGSQAKTALLDGYTQLVTDRVQTDWSCYLVTSSSPNFLVHVPHHQSDEGRGPTRVFDASHQGS